MLCRTCCIQKTSVNCTYKKLTRITLFTERNWTNKDKLGFQAHVDFSAYLKGFEINTLLKCGDAENKMSKEKKIQRACGFQIQIGFRKRKSKITQVLTAEANTQNEK